MDIEHFGSFIHKILYVYEDGVYENYASCLRNRIIYLNGMEDSWYNSNWVVMLNGLRELGDKATHDEVRAVVLEIMGDLRRVKVI